MGQRHINRGVIYRERQPKIEIDSPPELDFSQYGRVLVGRYVDMSAKIEHQVRDPLQDREYTVTSWGSFLDLVHSINDREGRKEKHFEVLDESLFVMYADVTDALNVAATKYSNSPRKVEQRRRMLLNGSKGTLRKVAHNAQEAIDASDARNALIIQKMRHEMSPLTDEQEEELRLQEKISIIGPIWSNGFRLPVRPQPRTLLSCHPNGDNLQVFPVVNNASLLMQEEQITDAFNIEDIRQGSIATQDEVIGVPFIRSHVNLKDLSPNQRPIAPKPPTEIPVCEIEVLS